MKMNFNSANSYSFEDMNNQTIYFLRFFVELNKTKHKTER